MGFYLRINTSLNLIVSSRASNIPIRSQKDEHWNDKHNEKSHELI